jgi:hypothetical protein
MISMSKERSPLAGGLMRSTTEVSSRTAWSITEDTPPGS